MKLSFPRKNLLEIFKQVGKVIPKRTPYPIVTNVEIQGAKNLLTFVGTDLDTYIVQKYQLAEPLEEPFRFLLPAQKMIKFLKAAESETVEFKLEERIEVNSGDCHVTMKREDPEEYPHFFKLDPKKRILNERFDAADLRQQTVDVGWFASQGEDRPAMTAICWELETRNSRMVTIDGHQLVRVDVPLERVLHIRKPRLILFSPKLLSYFSKKIEGEMQVEATEAHIRFTHGDLAVVARQIEGPYPDYRKVLEREEYAAITVNSDALYWALCRLGVFSNRVTYQTVGNITSQGLSLKVENPNGDTAEERISGHVEGDDSGLAVAWNNAYMRAGLRFLDGDKVRLSYQGALSSIELTDPENEHRLFLIMPILMD